jgi:hypothetical protein
MPDGSFANVGTIALQGAAASLTGTCSLRGCVLNQCLSFVTQDRDISQVVMWYFKPDGDREPNFGGQPLTNQGPSGTVYEQSIDSRIPDSTNGPLPRTLSTLEGRNSSGGLRPLQQ